MGIENKNHWKKIFEDNMIANKRIIIFFFIWGGTLLFLTVYESLNGLIWFNLVNKFRTVKKENTVTLNTHNFIC